MGFYPLSNVINYLRQYINKLMIIYIPEDLTITIKLLKCPIVQWSGRALIY